jgi:hypothetical protein
LASREFLTLIGNIGLKRDFGAESDHRHGYFVPILRIGPVNLKSGRKEIITESGGPGGKRSREMSGNQITERLRILCHRPGAENFVSHSLPRRREHVGESILLVISIGAGGVDTVPDLTDLVEGKGNTRKSLGDRSRSDLRLNRRNLLRNKRLGSLFTSLERQDGCGQKRQRQWQRRLFL